MWIVPHFATGCLIYEVVKEQPRYIKWPAVVTGGFLSHWLLDEVSSYHGIESNLTGFNIAIILLNVLCGLAIYLAYALRERRILPPAIISGLLAWLIFDFGWIAGYGAWIHNSDGSGFLPRFIRDTNDHKSSYIQVILMLWATVVLVIKQIRIADLGKEEKSTTP